MAEASVPPATQDPNPQSSVPEKLNSPPDHTRLELDSAQSQAPPATTASPLNPNPATALVPPLPPTISPYAPPPQAPVGSPLIPIVPPAVPSFRAVVQPPIQTPQFTPVPGNPNMPYQIQNPPGLSPPPGMMPAGMYHAPPGQPPNPLGRPPYGAIHNPYMPVGFPQGTIPPPGVIRYPYPAMVRAPFAPRPPGAIAMVPAQARPMIPGFQPQLFPSVARPPFFPTVAPEKKPHTKVYVGKIAAVENEFMLSLLELCGPVKDWKRAQDPTNGTLKGFGFCEFESAEGVLRALRLLSKLNVDGQELMLNIDKATREYLEHYTEKKRENLVKPNETETDEPKKDGESALGEEKGLSEQINGASKPSPEESKKDDNKAEDKDNYMANFGLVTDEDRETDNDAMEKIMDLIAERLRSKPLPPPPPLPPRGDRTTNSNSDVPAKSGDRESDADTTKKDEKNDDETSSDAKATSWAVTESPDRSRKYENRGRERDRDRDLKREKERELERIERERERERARRERERDLLVQKAEKEYERRVREWEAREKEKEKERKREKEREKERERERRRLVAEEEDDSDDDSRKRRRRSEIEDKRKRRRREKEDDMEDRLKEEEEIAEAKKLDEEQRKRQLEKGATEQFSALAVNGVGRSPSSEVVSDEVKDKDAEKTYETDPGHMSHIGDVSENGCNDDSTAASSSTYDVRPIGNIPTKKLGFGLVGSGKRTAVLSVFNEEEDDTQKEKKMRPLVPIDYSNDDNQTVHPAVSGATPPAIATVSELAKHKEGRPDVERERNRRSHDRSSYRERIDGENSHAKDEKEQSLDHGRDREHGIDTSKNADSKKVLDAKQLIDMIPRTKDELFSYDINWSVYDRHDIHAILRPWISKKIVEFLGEEENTLVDYIVSSTQKHVSALEMLQLLESILDEEAEMFVLKMWRMLIFEIKKVETGLTSRPRA